MGSAVTHSPKEPKAPMQPCSLERQLKLFPKLSERQISSALGAGSVLWQQLSEQFQHVQVPSLWPAGSNLTLKVLATACLTALFLALRYEAQHVGYWMVQASQAERAKLKAGQRASGFCSGTNCTQWWKGCGKALFEGKTQKQRDKLNEEAALALFLNPPVSKCGQAAGCKHACMVLRTGSASSRHIEWHKEYPYLVLQHACVDADGIEYKKLSAAAHQLIALLFLGKPEAGNTSARQVVCHYDVPPAVERVTWATQDPAAGPNLFRCLPVSSRCLSKGCVCPMCLHYGTQSSNARTGRQRQQVLQRRKRQKRW